MPLIEVKCLDCNNEMEIKVPQDIANEVSVGAYLAHDDYRCDQCGFDRFKRLPSTTARMSSWSNWSGG
jgi:hypothetical protein